MQAIAALGERWTGNEALAIAVFCTLRCASVPSGTDFFQRGILASVNHSGDSDSTGAVTGAILGAWLGVDAIPDDWLSGVEGGTLLDASPARCTTRLACSHG